MGCRARPSSPPPIPFTHTPAPPSLQVCVIVGNLWSTADVGLRRRVVLLLHQKGQTLAHVR